MTSTENLGKALGSTETLAKCEIRVLEKFLSLILTMGIPLSPTENLIKSMRPTEILGKIWGMTLPH